MRTSPELSDATPDHLIVFVGVWSVAKEVLLVLLRSVVARTVVQAAVARLQNLTIERSQRDVVIGSVYFIALRLLVPRLLARLIKSSSGSRSLTAPRRSFALLVQLYHTRLVTALSNTLPTRGD